MTIVVFGLPGAGKTYVGRILEKYFDFLLYDGDVDLSDEMHKAIKMQKPFTNTMRDEFFARVIKRMQTLIKEHAKLAVAQTFIKEKYRHQVRVVDPKALFLLVQTSQAIREKRLSKRKALPLPLDYARQMVANFEQPKIPHTILFNDEEGERYVKQQLDQLFSSQTKI